MPGDMGRSTGKWPRGVRQSTAECKGAWQSARECRRVQVLRRGLGSVRAWKVLGNHKMSNFRG
jgi:hypothetical protein